MTAASPSSPAPAPRPRNGHARGMPIFLLALIIGVGAHLAGLALFRLDLPISPPPPTPAPFVRFAMATDASQSEVMKQAAEVWDPQLVFAPASINYSSRAIAPTPRAQPRVFKAEAGRALPTPANDRFNLFASSGENLVEPRDSLKPTQFDFMATIGQAANSQPAPPQRGAQLRITPQRAGTDVAVMEVTWPAAMAPKAGTVHWQPATFLLVFNQTGLAGPPLLERSSGVTEVDNDLGAKLKQWYGRRRLPPGYYSVEIGQ